MTPPSLSVRAGDGTRDRTTADLFARDEDSSASESSGEMNRKRVACSTRRSRYRALTARTSLGTGPAVGVHDSPADTVRLSAWLDRVPNRVRERPDRGPAADSHD